MRVMPFRMRFVIVRRFWICLLLPMLLLVWGGSAAAQDEPVAYAVLMFSPYCPHCHTLIDEQLPPIMDEFGDSLRVLFVDVSQQGGQMLAQSAYGHYQIPQDRWVVPMMIIDDQVLIGGYEIPARLPVIVREGLANGGIPVPDFPGMRQAFVAAMEQAGVDPSAMDEPAARPEGVPDGAAMLDTGAVEGPSLAERLAADPLANAFAVVTLIALVISVGAVLLGGGVAARGGSWAALLSGTLALFIAITLVLGPSGDALATPLAWAALLAMVIVMALLLFVERAARWLIPLAAVGGLAAAIYLAYVEITQSSAGCGAVGNCNIFQQSPYAYILGVPVGVIGILGYIALLIAWALTRTSNDRLADLARIALLAMTMGGAAFSAYLTFLEPFVIGATCAWCLFSALVMLLLLWLAVPEALAARERMQTRITATG